VRGALGVELGHVGLEVEDRGAVDGVQALDVDVEAVGAQQPAAGDTEAVGAVLAALGEDADLGPVGVAARVTSPVSILSTGTRSKW
jgi:hypothetical protein